MYFLASLNESFFAVISKYLFCYILFDMKTLSSDRRNEPAVVGPFYVFTDGWVVLWHSKFNRIYLIESREVFQRCTWIVRSETPFIKDVNGIIWKGSWVGQVTVVLLSATWHVRAASQSSVLFPLVPPSEHFPSPSPFKMLRNKERKSCAACKIE